MRPIVSCLQRLGLLSLGCLLAAVPAAAHEAPDAQSGAPNLTAIGSDEPERAPVRWHGSILLFDQSVTTQTVGVGADYQSYDPTYEWWLAFKPRYYLIERKADAVSLNLWMNLYLELTNSDTTTRKREPLLGPTYLWGSYAHAFRDGRGYKTTATAGPRITFPTDKAAIDSGQIVGLGAMAGVSQTFPLAGKGARALHGARLALGTIYNHPFARSTSPVNSDIHQLRQDVGFGPLVSEVLRGGMNVRDSLSVALSGELQVLRKLSLSLSYVLLSSWRYAPPPVQLILDTGPVTPMAVPGGAATYGVSTWTTAAVTYDVLDQLAVSIGYYNLANQLAPSGLHRDPAWSPSARFFLTLTGNLDSFYRPAARARAPRTP